MTFEGWLITHCKAKNSSVAKSALVQRIVNKLKYKHFGMNWIKNKASSKVRYQANKFALRKSILLAIAILLKTACLNQFIII